MLRTDESMTPHGIAGLEWVKKTRIDLNIMGHISFRPMAMMLVYWTETQNTVQKTRKFISL
jgi:hypothetical protein